MRYIIRQDIDYRDTYEIFDERMELVYRAKSNIGWGYTLDLMDPKWKPIAELKKPNPLAFFMVDIFVNGSKVGRTVAHFSLTRHKYHVTGLDWKVEGEPFDADFDIWSKDWEHLASVKKERFAMKDTRAVHVFEEENNLFALMVTLSVDAMSSKRF